MATKKPNILILWGDDIGIWNISHFSRGMMGYQTPNLDRVAKEGVTCTDHYSQQSCTAGRACFICGQNPTGTALTKVGTPGAPVGGQTIVDTGPLTKKRMETIDEEITDKALAWMETQAKADKPFFLWYNATAMHFRTHVAAKNLGKSGQDPYSDRMVVHDEQIGMMLDKLDELGIADNTIVMYSTDNGPENDTWPDGANSPFRGQKDSNWEGGWRVPCFIRWPGKVKADSILNGIVSHIDMLPTLLAIAGNPDVKEQLLDGCTVGGKRYNVHLDGYNLVPYLTGQVTESPRNHLMYFSDDGEVMAVRVGDYKFILAEQRQTTMRVWQEPLVKLRVPTIINLRRDPFERADFNSNTYWDWMVDHVPQMYLMQAVVAEQIAGFVKFPPRQKPASFNLDSVLAQVSAHGHG